MDLKKLKKQMDEIINYTIEVAIENLEDLEKADTSFVKKFIYKCLCTHMEMKASLDDKYDEISAVINTAILGFGTGYAHARKQVYDILSETKPGERIAACEKILDN